MRDQHADHLEGWFCHSAGIKVVAPSTPADFKGLMLSAIDDPDPVIFIETGKTMFFPQEADPNQGPIPLGKARIAMEGTDVTIVSYSSMMYASLQAAAKLAEDGISAEVIDLRTVSPWDKDAVLASTEKTGRLVVVHEALRDFGPGAEIAATVQEELFGKLKAPVKRLGAPYSPVPFAKVLEDAFLVQPEDVVATVKEIVGK